jgi:toxin secretion/phage lysis holin
VKHFHEGIPFMVSGLMTSITAIFGGWDTAFQVFIACIILDIVTGVVKGFATDGFSSKRMRKGFGTKIGYLVVVALATQLDKLMPEDMPIIRTMAIWFYIAVESGSVIENLAQMGIPIPKVIVERLAVIRGKSGESAEIDEDNNLAK